MKKSVVTVSRKWHNPEIKTEVTAEGISLSMPLEGFFEAVVQELGPVTWVMRDVTFRKRLSEAIERVIAGIKDESAKVM